MLIAAVMLRIHESEFEELTHQRISPNMIIAFFHYPGVSSGATRGQLYYYFNLYPMFYRYSDHTIAALEMLDSDEKIDLQLILALIRHIVLNQEVSYPSRVRFQGSRLKSYLCWSTFICRHDDVAKGGNCTVGFKFSWTLKPDIFIQSWSHLCKRGFHVKSMTRTHTGQRREVQNISR